MQLPLFKTNLTDLSMLTQRWKSILDPLLASPLSDSNLLSGLVLKSGRNVINHKLGSVLKGYIVVMNSANVTYWDSQADNQTPDVTLVLNLSGASTISLLVF